MGCSHSKTSAPERRSSRKFTRKDYRNDPGQPSQKLKRGSRGKSDSKSRKGTKGKGRKMTNTERQEIELRSILKKPLPNIKIDTRPHTANPLNSHPVIIHQAARPKDSNKDISPLDLTQSTEGFI